MKAASLQRGSYFDCVDCLGHIMRPDNTRTGKHARCSDCQSTGESLIHGAAQQGAEHGLARDSDQHRSTLDTELRHPRQQGEIMLKLLAETDTRIKKYAIGLDSRLQAGL